MANLSESMNAKGSSTSRNVSDKVQNFGMAVEDASHKLGTRLGAVAGDVAEKTTDYIDTTRTYVKGHPIQSIAAAAAAGIIVGSLFSRARSKE